MGMGVTRTIVSFTIGMLIARAPARTVSRSPAIVFALLPLLCLPLFVDMSEPARASFHLLVTLGWFPLLLAAGSRVEPPALAAPALAFLGDVSYALYAIHLPFALTMGFLATRFTVSPLLLLPLFWSVVIATAALLTRHWDKPMRRWLDLFLSMRPSAMPRLL